MLVCIQYIILVSNSSQSSLSYKNQIYEIDVGFYQNSTANQNKKTLTHTSKNNDRLVTISSHV